jgi:hypothetical protein
VFDKILPHRLHRAAHAAARADKRSKAVQPPTSQLQTGCWCSLQAGIVRGVLPQAAWKVFAHHASSACGAPSHLPYREG